MSNIKQLVIRLLLFCCAFTFSGFAVAAQINLTVKNKPIREVIKEIERTSDYRFFYNDDLSGLS